MNDKDFPSHLKNHSCHVSEALRDVNMEMFKHVTAGTAPDSVELRQWMNSVANASGAHSDLVVACEEIVELGVNDERIETMKRALTQAQGQATYWARKDRW